MDNIAQLAKEIFWTKVRKARETPPVEKLLLGPRLFDFACQTVCDGIRAQHPNADDAEVNRILHERLMIQRRIERGR